MEGCRPAAREDLGRVLELARAMHDELGPMRGGGLWARREARELSESAYAAVLERDGARFLVGTIDDTVVGFAVGEVEPLAGGGLLGVVRDLFVEPGARGVGVGEALADDLVAHFAARGCVGIDALALPGHRLTKNFFEAHGFVSRLLVMHRPLATGETGLPAG